MKIPDEFPVSNFELDPDALAALRREGKSTASDEISPALTPEQWAAWDRGDPYIELRRLPNGRIGVQQERFRNDPLPLATISFANASLPDGDPRKFTHDDVQTLAEVIGYIEAQGMEHEDVDAIVAKLMAILPPRAEE
jgi:hypothetical protein